MSDLISTCLRESHRVLAASISDDGWLASAQFDHYRAIWTRDAALVAVALGLADERQYLDVTRSTLLGLAARQSELGQVPTVYWPTRRYWDWGEGGSTDGTALFVILGCQFLQQRPDEPARDQLLPAMSLALSWLRHQDSNNFGLIDSPQSADWMDSTLNRSGKLLYNNVLYFAAAHGLGQVHDTRGDEYVRLARTVREKGNILFWPESPDDIHRLLSHVDYPSGADTTFPHPATIAAHADAIRSDRKHYVAHVEYARYIDRCDVLANVLAVLFGFADQERSRVIMRFLASSDAVHPYPARSWDKPFTRDDDPWGMHKIDVEQYQSSRWHNPPHRYHNAGVWPFIGGYLVAALAEVGENELAKQHIAALAEANKLSAGKDPWGFHEWIDGRTGSPEGAEQQSWNAAAFVLAHAATEKARDPEAAAEDPTVRYANP